MQALSQLSYTPEAKTEIIKYFVKLVNKVLSKNKQKL